MRSVSSALISAFLAYQASAHGTVDSVTVGNTHYVGYPPTNPPGSPPNPAKGVVWASSDYELGFVLPEDYANNNIICHKNSSPAPKAADVAAGGSLSMSWPNWPASDPHPGVFLNYLAPAGTDDPTKIDQNSLQFFKISQHGYDSSVEANGDDKGLATGSFKRAGRVSQVQIPANIKPGLYVLRHEIIALHVADTTNGAQNYPQCITIKVSGSGTALPAGKPATQFYKSTDPGILVTNFYDNWDPKAYQMPGPSVWDGASSGTGSDVPEAVPAVGSSPALVTPSASLDADAPAATADNAPATYASDSGDSSNSNGQGSSDDVSSDNGISSSLGRRRRTRSSSPSTTLATLPSASASAYSEAYLYATSTSSVMPSASTTPSGRRRRTSLFNIAGNKRRHARDVEA